MPKYFVDDELVTFNCKFVCRSLVVMGPIFAVLRGVHVHYTISYKIHVHIFIIFIVLYQTRSLRFDNADAHDFCN